MSIKEKPGYFMKNKACRFNIRVLTAILDDDIMKKNEGAKGAWGQRPCPVSVPRTNEAVG